MNRGLGKSFGYNRMEGENETIPAVDLARLFIDVISKNGNMLLDIAPRADGTLARVQESRLADFGAWMHRIWGTAGTRPYMPPGHVYTGNERYTMSSDDTQLNIFVLNPESIHPSKMVGFQLRNCQNKVKNFKYKIKGKFHGIVTCAQPGKVITVDQANSVITFGNLALPRDGMPVCIQCTMESVILQTDITSE